MVKKTKREKSRGVCIRLNKLLFCHCDELSSLSLRGSETTKQSQSGIAALTSFARNDRLVENNLVLGSQLNNKQE